MGIDAEMYVRTTATVTDEQIRRWAFELGEGFGQQTFLLSLSDHWMPKGRRALYRVEPDVDGDWYPVKPETGETILRVSLFGRYYGPGYERGDPVRLIAIARWLEEKVPHAHVWYGGDSGEALEPFGESAREELWRHFVAWGHRPYMGGMCEAHGAGKGGRDCAFCGEPMNRHGFGGGRAPNGQDAYASFSCHGCGYEEVSRDGLVTFTTTAQPGGRMVKGTEAIA